MARKKFVPKKRFVVTAAIPVYAEDEEDAELQVMDELDDMFVGAGSPELVEIEEEE